MFGFSLLLPLQGLDIYLPTLGATYSQQELWSVWLSFYGHLLVLVVRYIASGEFYTALFFSCLCGFGSKW